MTSMTLQKGDAAYDLTIAAQATASDPNISIWASANAGAGKTKVLIDRIARLLLAGAQPGRILAVTYTKAAAAEMQTRLYEKLGGWTIADNGHLRGELHKLDPKLDLDAPGTLTRARALFARALETPGGLKIQTIHAFCQTILQRFPLEAGVPPGFQILDEATRTTLSRQAYEIAASKAPRAFLEIASLTSQKDDQAIIQAVLSNREGLASAAAADRPIMTRLAHALGLSETDTPEVLAQQRLQKLDLDAFSQAAGILETSSANDKKLALIIRDTVAKIHAAFAQNHFENASSHEQLKIVGANLRAAIQAAWSSYLQVFQTQAGAWKKKIYTNDMAKHSAVVTALGSNDVWPNEVCEEIGQIENKIRFAKLMRRSAALTQAAVVYNREWINAKRSIGTLDYDDLIDATTKLLSRGEGAAQWVLYKLDAGIEHILIDEAQDTSPDQWNLLKPLFDVLENEQRDIARTRFVVGDEKQSIYSFQGARPERFQDERQSFESGAALYGDGRQALTFDLSFRTGQTILNAVDAVWSMCQLGSAPPLASIEDNDPPFERKYAFTTRHSAFRSGQTGAVELWPLLRVDRDAIKAKPPAWDHPLNVEREDSPRNRLAEQIALELKHRIERGFTIWDKGLPRPLVASDVMVLVRKRGPFFHQLIRRLKYHKVPVAGADRIKLVEDPAIQDLIALGRFVLLPEDDFNTACVLKGAFCGLVDDDAHIFPLAWDRKGASLWKRLQESEDPEHLPVRVFLARLVSKSGGLAPYEFFAAILEQPLTTSGKTGWQALIERLGREAREPVEAFLSRALDFGSSTAPSLQSFLQQIESDAADVKREMDQDGAGVRVMTVHGAKGLEAPVVILPDTTSKGKPNPSSMYFDAASSAFFWSPSVNEDTPDFEAHREQVKELEDQEAARLLYVAMTRARDVLILCGHEMGKSEEGIPAGCWFEKIRDGLALLGPGQTVDASGFTFEKWGDYAPNSDISIQKPAEAIEPFPSWISQPPPNETPRPRRVAPSALITDGAEPPALSPLAPDARKRFLRGRLIHELLQRLPDLPSEKWHNAAQNRLKREADLDDVARAAIVEETLAVLNDPSFAPLFGPGSRAEAAIVGRGHGLPADMVVNGSVDRLVVTDNAVLVLDFKTNRPPPQRVEDVAEIYLNQMAAYRALLQSTWPNKTVRCALLWTDGPRLMEIPDAILNQALNQIAALPR